MPGGHAGERDVFAVFFGAVVFATMVIDVGVVDERGDEEGDSAEQIPYETEGGEFAVADVHQLVDEQGCPIVEEAGDKEAENTDGPMPGGIGSDEFGILDQSEGGDAEGPADEEVGPEDPGIGA